MARILFLTSRMLQGFGVDLAVHYLSTALTARGHQVAVVCADADHHARTVFALHRLPIDLAAVVAYAEAFRPSAIVAHTSPYYEMLPRLRAQHHVYAWEHGDPPAHFFEDREKRQAIKDAKI